jgi:hypothetical protein
VTAVPASKPGVDDEEREAVRAEGFGPDDPAVAGAIDLVRWELSLYLQRTPGRSPSGIIVEWQTMTPQVNAQRKSGRWRAT